MFHEELALPRPRPKTTMNNGKRNCGNCTNWRGILDVAEPPCALELLARPPDVKKGSILNQNYRQRQTGGCVCVCVWGGVFTFPKSARIPESSVEGGKLVTYNVDFHPRWTAISCPWIRFLSLVNAAGTLSCKGLVLVSGESDSQAPYPFGKFNGGNLEVCKPCYLNLPDLATL